MTSMTTPAGSDTQGLATELRVVLSQLSRRLRDLSSGTDFTHSQTTVVALLEREGPATMAALARALGVRPQSMGATVQTLEAAGLVAGSPDPHDGRKTLLGLTDRARELFASGRLAKEDWLFRAIRSELAPAEQVSLVASIALLRRLAQAR
jgi:DNA-binding MarR family transcriptional regulator